MAKKLDDRLLEILTKYEENPEEALWDCHGTWVAYHKAIERIAAKAGVGYETPQVLVAERDAAAILVTGKLNDKVEWSIGEAAINLNYRVSGKQSAYPFAMAEKRAKDRVVLKLIGLHGLVFSEEESDDFKRNGNDEPETPTKSSAQLKRDGAWNKLMFEVSAELGDVKTPQQLEKVKAHWREEAKKRGFTPAWLGALKNEFDQFEDEMVANLEKEEA